MKKSYILLIAVALIIGYVLSRILYNIRRPKLTGLPFGVRENNGLPILNFEIDGKKIEYIDGVGQGAGSIDDNIWSFQRFNKKYLISAFNTKTEKASAIEIENA